MSDEQPPQQQQHPYQDLFNIRTVTAFVPLQALDETDIQRLLDAVRLIHLVKVALESEGYTVQTSRIATNPFGEWLKSEDQLYQLQHLMQKNRIDFCALGPAVSVEQVQEWVPKIVRTDYFSCSADLLATDVIMAQALATCVKDISQTNALGNFRFAVAASVQSEIPFFPAAKAGNENSFAIGLENGPLAQFLLQKCTQLSDVPEILNRGLTEALGPVQRICETVSQEQKWRFAGIDTSFNPSLEPSGSIATALESLGHCIGGPGIVAVAAAVTKCLQSLPNIKRTGYCGIMLPLCEDVRLVELSLLGTLRIMDLLSISHVCGVGVDTVPVPGDVDPNELASLFLDVAAVADRWGKSLTCRVFPLPGKKAGDMTEFDFPHMINAAILHLN